VLGPTSPPSRCRCPSSPGRPRSTGRRRLAASSAGDSITVHQLVAADNGVRRAEPSGTACSQCTLGLVNHGHGARDFNAVRGLSDSTGKPVTMDGRLMPSARHQGALVDGCLTDNGEGNMGGTVNAAIRCVCNGTSLLKTGTGRWWCSRRHCPTMDHPAGGAVMQQGCRDFCTKPLCSGG
jgi:hypothetical protein